MGESESGGAFSPRRGTPVERRERVYGCKKLLIAILIAVLMTLFSGIYPGSVLYGWLDQNGLNFVWAGLTAGIIAACLVLYRRRKK